MACVPLEMAAPVLKGGELIEARGARAEQHRLPGAGVEGSRGRGKAGQVGREEGEIWREGDPTKRQKVKLRERGGLPGAAKCES